MRLALYYPMHFLGIAMILIALGALAGHYLAGATEPHPRKKLLAIVHGVGLVLAIVGGFGLMKFFGIKHSSYLQFPWLLIKTLIWVFLAAAPVLMRKMPRQALLIFFLCIASFAFAASAAKFKSFEAWSSSFKSAPAEKQP
ncbi:MAG: hypothetical protein RL095_1480 [Verrucomicrobiota bacterium]|jgi:cytochrome bd-type quinol oxidase subunit 2